MFRTGGHGGLTKWSVSDIKDGGGLLTRHLWLHIDQYASLAGDI